jgi:ATP-dependent helicase HrpA
MPKRFVAITPWTQLQHFGRYLKAIVLRLDKAAKRPGRATPPGWRSCARRNSVTGAWSPSAKGAVDERMTEFRWLLEELRVSFFAQELRTPQPVSVKRLDKVWTQLQG